MKPYKHVIITYRSQFSFFFWKVKGMLGLIDGMSHRNSKKHRKMGRGRMQKGKRGREGEKERFYYHSKEERKKQ